MRKEERDVTHRHTGEGAREGEAEAGAPRPPARGCPMAGPLLAVTGGSELLLLRASRFAVPCYGRPGTLIQGLSLDANAVAQN